MSNKFYVLGPENFATLNTDKAFKGFNYAIDNDFLFLFGGSETADSNSACSKTMYIYDIHENTWITKEKKFLSDMMCSSVCVREGEIYFFGGYQNKIIRKYSPIADRWFKTKLGNIPDDSGITMTGDLYCSRPCIVGDKVYIGGSGVANSNVQTNVFEYDFTTNTITNPQVFKNSAQGCTWLKVYPDESKFMQTMRLTSTAASVGYRYGEFGASSFTDSYSKDYTTSDTMVRNVVGEFEDGTILDVRANIDGGNRLTIKVIETKEDSNGKTYAEASEIYHEFEEPIIFSANEAKTANNMDSRDRMFIPYFTSADCNEIKLICISKSRYIKAKDQGIATTLTNKITNVKEVLSTKIDYEAETGTEIRIALSIDNNVTYKYFKNGSWATITDKNMVKNGEGMTPQEFENLTNDNFKLLIGNNESIDIDVLVTLYTNDESATPKIKKISFKTSELLTE